MASATKPFKVEETPLVSSEMVNLGLHSDQVYQWREEQFAQMGFEEIQVGYLASHRVDIHQMRTLIEGGCPHDLAIRILAGTDFHGEDPTDYASLAVQAVSEPPEAS